MAEITPNGRELEIAACIDHDLLNIELEGLDANEHEARNRAMVAQYLAAYRAELLGPSRVPALDAISAHLIKSLRSWFRNDGAEGETVWKLCALYERMQVLYARECAALAALEAATEDKTTPAQSGQTTEGQEP